MILEILCLLILSALLLQILPGLGESEFYYSMLLAAFYVAACVGTLLAGFLIRCVPYWYLYVTSTCFYILGYTIYGVATQGWHLMISQVLSGYFNGSVSTLGYCYITDSSAHYVELLNENGFTVKKRYTTKLRNYLFAFLAFGYLLGFIIGPGE